MNSKVQLGNPALGWYVRFGEVYMPMEDPDVESKGSQRLLSHAGPCLAHEPLARLPYQPPIQSMQSSMCVFNLFCPRPTVAHKQPFQLVTLCIIEFVCSVSFVYHNMLQALQASCERVDTAGKSDEAAVTTVTAAAVFEQCTFN